jgi:hypothetical protein
MDRIRLRPARGGEEGIRIQVARNWLRLVDSLGGSLVRRMDPDRPDAKPSSRAGDACRDLTSVGDEERPDGPPRTRQVVGPLPKVPRNGRERRTRHAQPPTNPDAWEPAICNPALDGPRRHVQLASDLAGCQQLIVHVAIVAQGSPP